MTRIAILFESHAGATAALAAALAEGVSEAGGTPMLARIAPLPGAAGLFGPPGPVPDLPEATPAMLAEADGLALGTPVHFGAPGAATLAFLASTGRMWMSRALAGRPATVFTGAGSGGGAEAAVLTLWSALASHGMILLPGQPQAATAEPGLAAGGGPFGAGRLAGAAAEMRDVETARARAQGAALTRLAARLKG